MSGQTEKTLRITSVTFSKGRNTSKTQPQTISPALSAALEPRLTQDNYFLPSLFALQLPTSEQILHPVITEKTGQPGTMKVSYSILHLNTENGPVPCNATIVETYTIDGTGQRSLYPSEITAQGRDHLLFTNLFNHEQTIKSFAAMQAKPSYRYEDIETLIDSMPHQANDEMRAKQYLAVIEIIDKSDTINVKLLLKRIREQLQEIRKKMPGQSLKGSCYEPVEQARLKVQYKAPKELPFEIVGDHVTPEIKKPLVKFAVDPDTFLQIREFESTSATNQQRDENIPKMALLVQAALESMPDTTLTQISAYLADQASKAAEIKQAPLFQSIEETAGKLISTKTLSTTWDLTVGLMIILKALQIPLEKLMLRTGKIPEYSDLRTKVENALNPRFLDVTEIAHAVSILAQTIITHLDTIRIDQLPTDATLQADMAEKKAVVSERRKPVTEAQEKLAEAEKEFTKAQVQLTTAQDKLADKVFFKGTLTQTVKGLNEKVTTAQRTVNKQKEALVRAETGLKIAEIELREVQRKIEMNYPDTLREAKILLGQLTAIVALTPAAEAVASQAKASASTDTTTTAAAPQRTASASARPTPLVFATAASAGALGAVEKDSGPQSPTSPTASIPKGAGSTGGTTGTAPTRRPSASDISKDSEDENPVAPV